MNEPFYHYLRNAELVFQNGSRITIYGDQLTEWRVTPDGARGKSEFVAGYMLKDILDPEAVAAIEIDAYKNSGRTLPGRAGRCSFLRAAAGQNERATPDNLERPRARRSGSPRNAGGIHMRGPFGPHNR